MPIYKQLPRTTQQARDTAPYRPIDDLLISAWDLRKKLGPILAGVVLIVAVALGLQALQAHRERLAWQLFDQTKLEEVVKKYPLSGAARVARIRLGKKALEEKRYDDAITLYQPLVQAPRPLAFYRIAALHNLALAYREKGDWQKAVSLLREAENDGTNVTPEYSRALKEETEKKWEEQGQRPSH